MKSTRALLAAALLCPALIACDDKDTTGTTQQAQVRFVNATNVAGLNFTANGAAGAQNVVFGTPSACQAVNAGTANFGATVAGGTTAFGGTATQTLTGGGRYTVVALGTAAAPQYVVLNDAATTPTAGRARLRVINAVPGSTSDIHVTAPNATLGTASGTSIGFGAGTTFLDVPAGETQIRFTAPGTQTVSYGGTPFTVTAGQTRTVIIAPDATPNTFRTVTVQPC
jgi:hypothetical protein